MSAGRSDDIGHPDLCREIPDRIAILAEWQQLIEQLNELPKLLTMSEMAIARDTLRDYLGEVRVDRTGKGVADLRLQRMVAGGGFVRFRTTSLRAAA